MNWQPPSLGAQKQRELDQMHAYRAREDAEAERVRREAEAERYEAEVAPVQHALEEAERRAANARRRAADLLTDLVNGGSPNNLVESAECFSLARALDEVTEHLRAELARREQRP